MKVISLEPSSICRLFNGKRRLEPYERLARYCRLNELKDMCDALEIEYNPKARKIDLALLLIQHNPNIKI